MARYALTQNRWARESLDTWEKPMFKFIVAIDGRHSKPAQHLRYFMRRHLDDDDLSSTGVHPAQLTSRKLDRICREYSTLLGCGDQIEAILVASFLDPTSPDITHAKRIAATHMCVMASSFRRRMVVRTEEFPLVLLRFAEEPRGSASDTRKRLAEIILNTDEERFDDSALFVKRRFADEFHACCESGMLGPQLCTTCLTMRRELLCSVAPNETLNSIIKRTHGRASNISPALRSARVALKSASDRMEATRDRNDPRNQRLIGGALVGSCVDAIEDKGN